VQIRVDLLGGGGIDCDPSPGRVFIVGPSHSFEVFAEAIDAAFARWDLSHLHTLTPAPGSSTAARTPGDLLATANACSAT
jgi:hypothetical protein